MRFSGFRSVTVPKQQSCSALKQRQGDSKAARCVSIKCHHLQLPFVRRVWAAAVEEQAHLPYAALMQWGGKSARAVRWATAAGKSILELQLNHPDPESVPCAVTVGLQSVQAFEMNQKCMPFWTTVSSCLQTCKDEQCRSNSCLPVEAVFVVESHY